MKLFLSLVLFGFCQFAFGAVSLVVKNANITSQCILLDADIVKTSNTSSTVTYTFTHTIEATPTSFLTIFPQCFVQSSPNTITNNIAGGWKFQAAKLDDIKFSLNNLGCGTTSLNVPAPNLSNNRTGFLNSVLVRATSPFDASCLLSYSITLVADPNSSKGTHTLNPLINVGMRNANVTPTFDGASIDNSLGSVTPDPAPQSTCSLSVPSNLSLGKAKPDAWRDTPGDTSRVNATNFNIAVNCSQKLTTTFTPKVNMRFEKPNSTSCFADNELTSADATNATIEIIRTVGGVATPICPATSTTPTTLAFTAYNPTSTQLYSDSITLQAAFRGASGDRRPKTGPFSTRATFTVKYE